MRRSLIVVALVWSILGCKTKLVYVPVYSCPANVLPDRPNYVLSTLDSTSSMDTVVKAWAGSFMQCQDYASSMRVLLEGYNKLQSEVVHE